MLEHFLIGNTHGPHEELTMWHTYFTGIRILRFGKRQASRMDCLKIDKHRVVRSVTTCIDRYLDPSGQVGAKIHD